MKNYQRPWLEVDHERAWKLILGGGGLLLVGLVPGLAAYAPLDRFFSGISGLPVLLGYGLHGLIVFSPGFLLSGIWILSRGPREGRPGWIHVAAYGLPLVTATAFVDSLRIIPPFSGFDPGARAFVELAWILSFVFVWIAWWSYDVVRRERDLSRARASRSGS